MPRFFAENTHKNAAYLSKEDEKHALKVLRMKHGDKATICYEGRQYSSELDTSGERVFFSMVSEETDLNEADIFVTLYQCLPKQNKLEFIAQKSVELGVGRIIPVMSKYCVAKENAEGTKIQRCRRIIAEAAKQCGRMIEPEMTECINLIDLAPLLNGHELLLLAWEGERMRGLRKALTGKQNVKDIGIVIGPEGGLGDDEISLFERYGGISVSLGKRILRTETAGIALLSALMFHYGQWEMD